MQKVVMQIVKVTSKYNELEEPLFQQKIML